MHKIAKFSTNRRASDIVRLGDVLGELVENRVLPAVAKFRLITENWNQILPTEICQHCKVISIDGGKLKVIVDSSSYMYELQLLKGELLKELNRRCPRVRVKEIKLSFGSISCIAGRGLA